MHKKETCGLGNVSFSIDWIFQHYDGREDSQLLFSSRPDQSGAQRVQEGQYFVIGVYKKVGCGIGQKKSTGRQMDEVMT